MGYKFNNLLDTIGLGITEVYTDDEIKAGVSYKISADGLEDRYLTTKKKSFDCYLQYGMYINYESREEVFGGYKIVNAINSGNVEIYDFTTTDHITITFLSPVGEEE